MKRSRQIGHRNLLQGLLMLPLLAVFGSCSTDAPPRAALVPTASPSPAPMAPKHSIVAISAVLRGPSQEFASQPNLNGARLASALEGASRAVGTGFAVARGGYVLTANHVVLGATQIWLTTSTGAVKMARVVAIDDTADLALLHAEGLELAPLEIAASLPSPGQRVYTYGNPGGRGTAGEFVYSNGLVGELNCTLSRLSRREHRDYSGMIQSFMPLTPGDSGGPLLDGEDRVVGINAAAVLPSPDTPARGYAFAATPAWLARVQTLLDRAR